MIPWVREKFAERRAKWIASRKRNEKSAPVNGATSPGPGCSGCGTSGIQNSSSLRVIDDRLETMSKLKSPIVDQQISKEHNVIKDKIRVRVISPSGRAKVIHTELNKKLIDLKHDALLEFCDDSGSLPYFATDVRLLSSKYRLIRSEFSSKRLNDGMTLNQNGINDNDTLLLSVIRSNSINNRNYPSLNGPSSNEIFDATRNITCSQRQPPTVDINEIFQQSNLQFDVRKVLISLAQTSARIIGSGPFAPRLIDVLKQKLINKRTHQTDTIQCLVDMGFKKEHVVYALRLNNNVYAATLDWLITHQNDESINTDYRISSSHSHLSPSTIIPTNNVVQNTEALLEIVRIYSHREIPPPPETIRALVDMGFNENEVIDALKRTYNNKASACEWLCGNRNASLLELREGLSTESPILLAILELPQVQTSLSNPKMFLAFLSILENENTLRVWGGDSDTTSVITHILQKYHEEKHVLGINQFHSSLNSR